MLPILALLFAPAAQVQDGCVSGPAWGSKSSPVNIRNILSYDHDSLAWNHSPVSREVLRLYLHIAATISPRPELVIDTTGMSCTERQRIAAEVEADYPCTPDICLAYDVLANRCRHRQFAGFDLREPPLTAFASYPIVILTKVRISLLLLCRAR